MLLSDQTSVHYIIIYHFAIRGGENMKEIILSLVAGAIVGILFKFLKLPLPAPPVLAGVLGIVGVYLGGVVGEWILNSFKG
jgi:XapX domain-containing protein